MDDIPWDGASVPLTQCLLTNGNPVGAIRKEARRVASGGVPSVETPVHMWTPLCVCRILSKSEVFSVRLRC